MRPIVLLLTCAAIVACGSDGGELSVEEYRDRANELCADANRAVEELDPPRSPDDLADFLERGLEEGRTYQRRFDELDAPEPLESLHQRAKRLGDEIEGEYEDMIRRIRAAPDPIAEFRKELERLLPAVERSDEISRRLKLDECLQAPELQGAGTGPA